MMKSKDNTRVFLKHPVAFFLTMVVAGLLSGMSTCFAQTITPVDEFSFGSFAIKDNTARHMLRVSRTGGVTADPEFIIFSGPTPAEYNLSGFPAFTPLNVTIPDSTVTSGGGGAGFTLESFTPTPSLTTDGSGNATLLIGASLYTSGNSALYVDGAFSGTIDITITY